MRNLFARLHRARRNEKGFTLVELLVVVIIIGIIAAIAVPRFMGQTDKARESAVLADLRSMKTVVELHYADEGELPSTSEIEDVMQAGGIDWGNLDNPWGEAYKYDVDGSGDHYVIYTQEEEDENGTFYYVSDTNAPSQSVGWPEPDGFSDEPSNPAESSSGSSD